MQGQWQREYAWFNFAYCWAYAVHSNINAY